MIPSIDTRIMSAIKALEQVVLPALPPGERLAREQCEITMGHLRVLASQWRHAVPMARRELALSVGLVERLLPSIADPDAADFSRALEAARRIDADDHDAIEAAGRHLGALLDQWLKSAPGLFEDAGIQAVVKDHARLQSHHERIWFAAAGIANAGGLPSIADYLASPLPGPDGGAGPGVPLGQ